MTDFLDPISLITSGAIVVFLVQQARRWIPTDLLPLVALAVGDAKRSPLAPQVPTLVELGYKDVVVSAWNGFFAPRKTPAAVIALLNEHLNAILQEPEVVEKLATFGALPAGGTPKVLAELNQREYAVMGKAIRDLGIAAE